MTRQFTEYPDMTAPRGSRTEGFTLAAKRARRVNQQVQQQMEQSGYAPVPQLQEDIDKLKVGRG